MIERNEGLRLNAYQDSGGVWTIGYGDTGPDVVPGLVITREEASRRLSDRLAREFEPGVRKAIGAAPTTQAQFDSMVSLSYNIGVGAFARSSVVRRHIAGDYVEAANEFLAWNKAGRPPRVLAGLVRRRTEERALYLSGPAVDTSLPVSGSVDTASAPHNPVELQKDVQRALAAAGDYGGQELILEIVKTLQAALKASGHYAARVDGVFGPLSYAAIQAIYRE
jgi:lysozyme